MPTSTLWDELEEAVRARVVRGSRRRVNLTRWAPRDKSGNFLKNPLPSDRLRSGRVYELCKRLMAREHPNFEFIAVQLNKFRHHTECGWHRDGNNRGKSAFARVGDRCDGGALELDVHGALEGMYTLVWEAMDPESGIVSTRALADATSTDKSAWLVALYVR